MSDNASVTPPMPPATPAGSPSAEERQWGMFAHFAAFLGFLIPGLGGMIGPLIVWQMKKAEMPFVDDQGKEALNFQITVFLAVIVCAILTVILIGFLLLMVVGLGALVFTIIGGIKANEGVAYRYPFTLRLIK
ncbi:MAG: DUF4870 domain-containing protein [Xanthomonadales bacterium]|nr:DUF4870 domain-containing protein [Xanthomonadales bacterium]